MTADGKTGFCFRHSVEQTADKGLGVFAAEPIGKGSLVWRFVPGCYAVYDEPAFKAVLAKLSHDAAVYELTHVFGLEELPDCVIRVFDDGGLINHDKAANLATNFATPRPAALDPASATYVQEVTATLLAPRYGLIATRDIAPGEEFTNDYSEVSEPPFYEQLYDDYGVTEDYMEE